MKKTFLIGLLITMSLSAATAQRISRINSGVDYGTGFQNGNWAPSVHYFQNLSTPNLPWLQVSWGLRAWGYYGGGATLEAPDGASGYDKLTVNRLSANGASFLIGFNLRLNMIDVGINTDLLSFAFGKRREGLYSIANLAAAPDSIVEDYNLKRLGTAPTNLNALSSIWRGNNGQTEAYVRIRINEQVGVKVGYLLGRVAYRTDLPLNNRQSRFSTPYSMPYLGVVVPLD